MGLIRKTAWLASGGIVRPTSKKEKRHAELLAAIQGKDAKTVRRAGGRYDASNLFGGTPDGTPLFSTGGNKGSSSDKMKNQGGPGRDRIAEMRARKIASPTPPKRAFGQSQEGYERLLAEWRAAHGEEV
jgi:hypothetical protein